MEWLFASGHAVDVVLLTLTLEFMWLTAFKHWQVTAVLLRLGPGAMMLIALRSALVGNNWPLVAVPLFLSFPLHLADLKRSDGRPGD